MQGSTLTKEVQQASFVIYGTPEVMLDAIRTDGTPVVPSADTEDPPLASPVQRTNPFAEHGG